VQELFDEHYANPDVDTRDTTFLQWHAVELLLLIGFLLKENGSGHAVVEVTSQQMKDQYRKYYFHDQDLLKESIVELQRETELLRRVSGLPNGRAALRENSHILLDYLARRTEEASWLNPSPKLFNLSWLFAWKNWRLVYDHALLPHKDPEIRYQTRMILIAPFTAVVSHPRIIEHAGWSTLFALAYLTKRDIEKNNVDTVKKSFYALLREIRAASAVGNAGAWSNGDAVVGLLYGLVSPFQNPLYLIRTCASFQAGGALLGPLWDELFTRFTDGFASNELIELMFIDNHDTILILAETLVRILTRPEGTMVF
jgi:hypothetical protein